MRAPKWEGGKATGGEHHLNGEKEQPWEDSRRRKSKLKALKHPGARSAPGGATGEPRQGSLSEDRDGGQGQVTHCRTHYRILSKEVT